ncbi:hypothetical protein AAG612_06950 [Citromicrobium bathyomarinum]|mgnify:CR=1 FL=1|uniref:hypothetical protein n=1 Tax=Citromicrobium bathyomarinum TaxID=72174 RepID=UPI003159D303
MLFIAAFLAPALALAPAGKGEMPLPPFAIEAAAHTGEAPIESRPRPAPGWLAADAWRTDREARQVRIRQEIMIRVSPRRPNSQELVADWRRVLPLRYDQRKIGNCLPARSIVAVQTVSSRDLVLHLSDKRMIRAQLRKSCNARDFYLGFYLEPTEDGELCVGRDTLKARNGATCKIGGIRELVPAE